jgi:DNA-binding MarR family transcriptional regulator
MGIKNSDYSHLKFINENLQRYISEAIDNLTPEQRERIPMALRPVLLDGGPTALSTLSMDTLLFVLHIVIGKKLAIVVSDPQGMDVASFIKLYDGFRDLSQTDGALQEMKDHGIFVLGSYDLVRMLEFYNMISAGPAYRALLDYRSGIGKKNRTLQQREEKENAFLKIVKLLSQYESQRGRLREYGISEVEWFIMMNLTYQEVKPQELLEDWTENGHFYHKRYIRDALSRLVKKELVYRHGAVNRKGVRYYLTPAGRTVLNRIIDQVVLER